ncbi:hypothetical protein PENTCL1PPCAC_7209 [Pristionchus entomophagus]|uniref:Apple domain-containing protein n=1 Tax=Pristionchus entomophagus TaxID=358040 RepID=A0AAV5SUI4_9BILA|nr:hypothetical protein PENTCL1PPCAC_7209 [Pristionchus entomophagus]
MRSIFLLLLLLSVIYPVGSAKRKQQGRFRIRRAPSSFTLAYLQRDAETESDEISSVPREQIRLPEGSRRRDFVVNDAKCLARCNKELTTGMDMVDAHTAFGSIDVPSVMSAKDLELFCSLDAAHSQCIDDCGYSVQFNLREYICRRKRQEMTEFIPCYRATAPFLTRYCRPRCGAYHALEHSTQGYGARCRQLLCDHTCTEYLLRRVCGAEEGRRASDFLLHFSRIQVDFWISDYARVQRVNAAEIYPSQCLRLHCDGFDLKNCPRIQSRTLARKHTN